MFKQASATSSWPEQLKEWAINPLKGEPEQSVWYTEVS